MIDERSVRLAKIAKLREQGIHPYPEKFDKRHSAADCLSQPDGTVVRTAGRLMSKRDMGAIIFGHLQDDTGRIQLVFKQDVVGPKAFSTLLELVDMGDFVGIQGERFATQKGEPSILVREWTFLGKAIRPLPDKFHGLKDRETIYRQRYLDLVSNRESFDRFLLRSRFIKLLREFYWQNGFVEIESSTLGSTASGALARPFVTHHDALDQDFYLRIAIETPQKEAIVGGFEKTFEIGKVFRNEGMDPSHLQEFTACEHYAAWWNYQDNIRFTESMLEFLTTRIFGTTKVSIPDAEGSLIEADFKPPYPVVSFRELLLQDAGIDINTEDTAEKLRAAIRAKDIVVEDMDKLGFGNLVDALYKKTSRRKIVNPTFLIGHPVELSPLARKNDADPRIVDRFQLVAVGWELVNAYSELVDPIDQAQRFEQQAAAQEKGDDEAHGKDDEYVKAMEYGMPPISGWGMGIDRMVALLTKQDNLRDVVLFPLVRPEEAPKPAGKKDLQIAVAVVNRGAGLQKWQELNTVAHLTAAFGARTGKELFFQDEISTKEDEHIKLNIQHAILIKEATDSQTIHALSKAAKEANLEVADFTREMLETTNDRKVIERTKEKTVQEIDFLGTLVFGPKTELDQLTKDFPLYQGDS